MIKFPKNENTKYYEIHYQYLLNVLREYHTIELVPATNLGKTKFVIKIEDNVILIDFNDFTEIDYSPDSYDRCFKFHYNYNLHKNIKNLFPLSPVSFYNWHEFNQNLSKIKYTCNTDKILCNQRPYGDAIQRRKYVQSLLKQKFQEVDTKIYPQQHFWNQINECLVSVCVPGARNNMIDRGQLQYMGLGCCTISPELTDSLCFNSKPIPGYQYISCKNDYSDLEDKINWCKANRNKCVEIGKNAKHLFQNTCTPKAINDWMWECL